MKKNRLTGMMSAALATAMMMAVPVGATAPEPQRDSTTVTTDIASSFVLTIPATTNITYGVERTQITGTLKVTGNVDTNEQVTVAVETSPLHNQTHNENIIYTVTASETGEDAFTGDVWTETELRDETKEIPLYVLISGDAWSQAKAGDYEGTITFTAQLSTVKP